MKLTKKQKNDALKVVGGLYSLNEKYASYYFFNVDRDGVSIGEFYNKLDNSIHVYNYYYSIATGVIGEVKELFNGGCNDTTNR